MFEGRWSEDKMRHLGMEQAEVRTAIAQEGLNDLVAVCYGFVERDGTISIIAREKK